MPLDDAPRITRITRRSRGRAVVVTDDGETLALRAETVARAGLVEGALIDATSLAQIDEEEQRVAAHEGALRLLSRRARSEREMAGELRMRGLTPAVVDHEIARLRKAGLLDDEAFAHSWVQDRATLAPRGRRLLRQELRGRGVTAEIIETATEGTDDGETALALARQRAGRLSGLDFETFRKRLAGFLGRRGIGYGEIAEATRIVWEEVSAEAEGD